MKSLIDYLEQIPDPRKAKGIRHKQANNLVIMIMAIMCGYSGLNAIARFAKAHAKDLAKWLVLPRGKVPSSTTIKRLSKAIDSYDVCNAFNKWMQQDMIEEEISIDGKSIKSTVVSSQDSNQNFISLVSFFGQQSHLIRKIGKLENGKSSEIEKVQKLLETFELKGCTFTFDALHCQKKQLR